MSHRRWVLSVVVMLSAVLLSTGCDSLRRKFTRTKKSEASQESMVIAPRDYSAHPFPNDVLYRQYFTYWKSWNQELVRSLEERASHKKILDCAEQCLLNLNKMKGFLKDEQAAQLDVFMKKTERLRQEIAAHPSFLPSQYDSLRYDADRIYSNVNRQFDGHKMKDAMKASGAGS